MLYISIANVVIFTLLTLVWSTKGWFNFIIKSTMFTLGVVNAFMTLQLLGFIVKV